MDWVSSPSHEDSQDVLLNDLSRVHSSVPPQMSSPELPPLVVGLLASAPTNPVSTEWPMSTASRNLRTDFRYEFSLSAGPEFDTDSAVRDDELDLPEEDNVSADFQHGASTSEDTSLGLDPSVHSAKPPLGKRQRPPYHVSPKSAPPSVARLSHPPPSVPAPVTKELSDPSANRSVSASKPMSGQKPAKTIQKSRSFAALKNAGGKIASNGASAAPLTTSGGTSGVQSGGTLSHTKMCRDRLNNMFERLRHTLPPAPSGVEVKHKAQVLDYAIAVLKGMVDRTSQLEIELAVSSSKATMDWISKLVTRAENFPDAAQEVMRLFCKRRAWTHAELWTAGKRPVAPETDPEESIVLNYCSSVSNTGPGQDPVNLQRFSKESKSFVFRAKQCVQGRVWSSMRPEWVAGLSDPKIFRRSALARKYGLKVCLAVPVTITGKIEAIMCFYDVKHRPYDLQCLELAMRLGWALGNAVGVQRAQANVLELSGTSGHDCKLARTL